MSGSSPPACALVHLTLLLVLGWLTACNDASDYETTAGRAAPPQGAEQAAEDPPTDQDTLDAPAVASDDDLAPLPMEWLSVQGTSIVGFGMLRLTPPAGGPGRFRIRYSDSPDGYGVTDNAQLFVLRGDAFAQRPMAYGHEILAFNYDPGTAPDTPPEERSTEFGYPEYTFAPTLHLDVEFEVDAEGVFLIAYGPWTDPDTGRPPGDRHTVQLTVTALPRTQGGDAGSFAWIESEAGELITSNWSHRPMLARGEPIRRAVFHGKWEPAPRVYLEIRPLILYDARLARAAGEPPDLGLTGMPTPAELRAEADVLEKQGKLALAIGRRDRATDLEGIARRRDHHLVLTPELAEKFRRVPIRWR